MNWRYRFLLLFFSALFLLVISRLFYWQVIKASELSEMGKRQYGQVVQISAKRGEIITSDGFPIVTNKVSYTVYANPKEIADKNLVSQTLAPLLEVDTASISANLSLNLFWVPLKTKIEIDKKTQIEKLNLKGVGFKEEYTRFYAWIFRQGRKRLGQRLFWSGGLL
jgi:cell division protein FtsI (penicillin-binding protein 3)